VKYHVEIPVAGVMHAYVEASSAEEAKTKAWDDYHDGKLTMTEDEIEWEVFETLAEGNCFYGPLLSIHAYEVK